MNLITIHQEKCIGCGACAAECPARLLAMEGVFPRVLTEEGCISCGHCVAVCPRGALDNRKTPLEKQAELKDNRPVDRETAEKFLRFRRSVRAFKADPVPRELLSRLVDMAHFAPTGGNSQGIAYTVIDNKAVITQALADMVAYFKETPPLRERLAHHLKAYEETGYDGILRGAPCLVLATADRDFMRARENAVFSLAYLELYAPVLGLGSCWAGIAENYACQENSPLLKLFKIPEGKRIAGVVMVGYPQYRYHRLVDRNPLSVDFYEEDAK